MGKIHKLTKGGQTIYPATVTDAVVNPNSRKSLTAEISALGTQTNNIIQVKNIIIRDKAYDLNTGKEINNINYKCIPKISFLSGKRFTFYKGSAPYFPTNVFVYDNNGELIKKYGSSESGIILENGQSFAFNILSSNYSDEIFIKSEDFSDEIKDKINNEIYDVKDIEFVNTGFIRPDGNVGIGKQGYTDFIELSANKIECYDVTLIGQRDLIAIVSYYSSADISTIIKEYTIAQESYTGIIDTLAAKEKGAKYIRFSSGNKSKAKCLQKISKSTSIEIVNNLTEGGTTKVLSAEQGKSIGEVLSNFTRNYSYTDWKTGYIKPGGKENDIDTNWVKTDYISIGNINRISIDLKGHSSGIVAVVAYYKEKTGTAIIEELTQSQKSYNIVIGKKDLQNARNLGASYIRFSSDSRYQNKKIEISEFFLPENESDKADRYALIPYKIYTVLNDIDKDLFKGNYSAGIYLDHFFKGIKEEYDIYFGSNKSDRIIFTSPNKFTGVSKNELNRGENVLKENYIDFITGNDIKDKDFTILHISTLNSITKSKKAHFLCIGDSVTFGQYANIYGTISDNMYRYSAICEELSVKDRILNGTYNSDNSDTDYVIRSVGNSALTKTGHYEETDYTFVNSICGISGATSAEISEIFIDDKGKFSITKYLSKFRTCDDLGTYLNGVAGEQVQGNDGKQYTIGSEIKNINLKSPRCYRPTHIIIASGLNDAGSTKDQIQSWYDTTKKMVDEFKEDYTTQGITEPFIAIMLPDTGGTIFPSRHPNVGRTCIEWDEFSDSRRDKMNGFVKKWMQENTPENEDEKKCWLLPSFWCFPCGESVSYRPANLPDYEIDSQKNISKIQYGSGWCQSTHVNAIGHYNYAYQLYSWIKYTLTL